MQINQTALSLNVTDPAASATWVAEMFGFTQEMAADGFISLTHPTAGANIIFLRTGLPTFTPERAAGSAGDGLLIAFVVDDIDAEHKRLVEAGAEVVTEPTTEPWGERFSQYLDPNGIVYQLVTWVADPA